MTPMDTIALDGAGMSGQGRPAWTLPRAGALSGWTLPGALARVAGVGERLAVGRLSLAGGVALGYWSCVAFVDFLNDWLVTGMSYGFRPWTAVGVEVVIWWSTWVLATPWLVGFARRRSAERVGWPRSLLSHAAVSAIAVTAHFMVTAWIFGLFAPPGSQFTVADRAVNFASRFTLSEVLVYWGLVAALYATAFRPARGGGSPRVAGEIAGLDAGHAGASAPARRILVREDESIRFIPVASVDWIEAQRNYLLLHAGNDIHRVRASLQGVLERLDANRFVRIHRSAVVNVDSITEVQPWFGGDYVAILKTGRRLKVSRTYRDLLLRPFL